MRLSELQIGEKAIVVKVLGRGAFRKRIIEMGFVRGQEVVAEYFLIAFKSYRISDLKSIASFQSFFRKCKIQCPGFKDKANVFVCNSSGKVKNFLDSKSIFERGFIRIRILLTLCTSQ